MRRSPAAPPSIAERLLLLCLGRGDRADSIVGDLHEEYCELAGRVRPLSRARAQAWYVLHTCRLGSRYAIARAAAVRPRRRPEVPAPAPVRGDSAMRTITREARYALRAVFQRPGLSALVIFTLALGLGANAAIFEIIDALVLRPFSIPQVDRIAMLSENSPGGRADTRDTVSPANFLDWKKQADVFERLAAFEWWDVNLAGGDEPERISGFLVSADFFPILGVQPALGRMFTADEETRGRHRRVVLGYGLWQRRFGGDGSVVGKPVRLDAETYEIIGVAPRGFDFPMGAQAWAPLSFDAATAARRDVRYLSVIGRLAPGRSLEDANAQMAVVADRLARQYPESNRDHGARASTLLDGMRDQGLGPILALWQASAAFVLLIACANIANLLLARGAERQRDIAVRLAIGASRARLIRELLLESAVLAIAAVPAALGVAWLAIRLVRVNMPPRIIRFITGWDHLDLDGRLIAFTALLALGTAVVFGMLPAFQASRPRLTDALKDGGRGASAGRQRQRVRRALVIAEIALALPLLVASGLGTIGANRFLNGPQGYDPDGVLTLGAALPDAVYFDAASRRRFTGDVVDRLERIPGVESAAAVNIIPSDGPNASRPIEIDGRPNPDPANPPMVDYRAITPDFFDSMRIPIVRGRGFTKADREDAQPVAIVTEALAARHFPGTNPLGKRIKLGSGPWATIVGVSRDIIHDWFGARYAATAYRPYAQAPTSNVVFTLRTAADPRTLATAARRAVRDVDPAQPVFGVLTMRELLYEKTIGLQYVAVIMALFGAMALVLAVVGVYSLMAFVVTQRTHEIGVRMALGATRTDVLRMAAGQAARLTCVGALIGLALATALGRLMEAGLLGIVSSDVRVSMAFTAILVASGLAAGYVPARRATAVDPSVALRSA